MATSIFCCGAECGQAGTAGQHWAFTGAMSFSTTIVRSGARSIRWNPSAVGGVTALSVAMSSSSTWVIRGYIRFAALPTDEVILVSADGAAGLYFKISDGKLYTSQNGTGGFTPSLNVWYRFDIKTTSTTRDLSIDGVAQPQEANGVGASTQVRIGPSALTVLSGDVFFDDVIVSQTAGDYPIGAGYVNHFVPTADGTHNVAGAADFRRGDTTTDITNSTTTAYQLVDEVPLDDATPDTDDHIRIVAPANVTDYVELVFGPAPGINTPTVGPRSVEVIAEVFAAGTGLSDEIIRLNDNGTLNVIYDGTGLAGVTTGTYKRKHYATAPSTGVAWTAALFNALKLRYGYATDANPDKSLMCVMIEADYVTVVADDGYPFIVHEFSIGRQLLVGAY